MTEQLTLNLPHELRQSRADFFVSPSNALALAELDRWQSWPQRKLILTGPAATGKSHLARIWASQSRARILPAQALTEASVSAGPSPAWDCAALVVEDVPNLAGHPAGERALLHLHNLVLAEGGVLLLTGRGSPARWPVQLPDLASRIGGTPVAEVAAPDDALLKAVVIKLFADRGIDVPPSLVTWLVPRMERSCAAARDLVADIDAAALQTGRPVGRKLAGAILNSRADGVA